MILLAMTKEASSVSHQISNVQPHLEMKSIVIRAILGHVTHSSMLDLFSIENFISVTLRTGCR